MRATTLKRIVVLAVGLVVLSSFLAGVTYATYRTATFEEDARAAVTAELAESETTLELLSVSVEYEEFPVRQPTRLIVTVGYPFESEPPPLADRLQTRIRTTTRPSPLPRLPIETDGEVDVEVRYVALDNTTAR